MSGHTKKIVNVHICFGRGEHFLQYTVKFRDGYYNHQLHLDALLSFLRGDHHLVYDYNILDIVDIFIGMDNFYEILFYEGYDV